MVKAPDANPKTLLSLIDDVYRGKVVVPEFQRSFVWGRSNIEEFLTSLLHGYFIGTFLVLDTSAQKNKAIFPYRTVDGVKKVSPKVSPKDQGSIQLVLDGQQRITSLFYAFHEPDIPLKNSKHGYRFFLDLEQSVNEELDEAVIGIPRSSGKKIEQYEKLCKEFKAIPFRLLGKSREFYKWLYQEQSIWDGEQKDKLIELHQHIEQFMVPVVALPEDTPKEDIVNIFERINRTGISLSLFDLAVAQLYQRNINLRKLWDDFKKQNKGIKDAIQPVFLLRVIALLKSKEIRKSDLLDAVDIEEDEFSVQWNISTKYILKAYKRITEEYGAFNDKYIPYNSLLITLAVLLQKLEEKFAGIIDYKKVDRWYWRCVLSGRYDRNIFTKTSSDIRDFDDWLNQENKAPSWLQSFSSQELSLGSVNDSRTYLYKGILCLLVCQGAKDFLTGQPAKLFECQDDHIFPKSKYSKGNNGDKINSILNRTLIWDKTNNRKKNKSPSEFFQECLKNHGNEDKLLETLESHFISPDAYEAIKNNNFDTFISEREKTIQEAIKHLIQGL